MTLKEVAKATGFVVMSYTVGAVLFAGYVLVAVALESHSRTKKAQLLRR